MTNYIDRSEIFKELANSINLMFHEEDIKEASIPQPERNIAAMPFFSADTRYRNSYIHKARVDEMTRKLMGVLEPHLEKCDRICAMQDLLNGEANGQA